MQTRLRKTGLTASIAIIALSVILAVGSTFSLFTSNDGNDITISSATVKVTSKLTTLETYSLGKATETAGKFDNFGEAKIEAVVNEATNVAVDTLKITNMTPGDEARVTIDIENTSTVRIAYRLKVTVDGDLKDALNISVKQGDVKLALDGEYTQWAYTTEDNNEIKDLSVSVLLPTDTDNTYQTKNATVKFAIEAVQANAAELVTVTTADQLYAALKTNNSAILGGNIKLAEEIILDGDAELDLAGYTLEGNIENNGVLVIEDSKAISTGSTEVVITEGESGSFIGSITNNGTLTIKGGAFSNTGAAVITNVADATLVIEGGSFTSTIEDFAISYEETKNITISGGDFSGNIDPEELAELSALANNGMGATVEDGKIVFVPVTVNVNNNGYATLEVAVAAAKAGDEIKLLEDVTLTEALTLPADVIFDGNSKNISGTIYAGGNLTFAGHTKVTSFSASYYDRVITIGAGACLEITGSGRVSLAYGNVFNITGTIADAKTADKANIQPSLIIPGGISITGGSDAEMNVTNAYVIIGSTSSKNSSANGTFTFNFENSVLDFTNQFTLAEPTSGMNPTFNMSIKDSVFTTGTKLCVAAANSNIVVDNSNIILGSYFRNSGNLTLKNGSKLTGSSIQFGENGGNDGTTIVDASEFIIANTSSGHAVDGKGIGAIKVINGAKASIDYIKDIAITVDTESTFTTKGTVGTTPITIDAANWNGLKNIVFPGMTTIPTNVKIINSTLDPMLKVTDAGVIIMITAKGSISPAYTSNTAFWGEGGGNAYESYVITVYEGDKVIATASLNNIGGIIDGDVYVTWNIPFAGSNDEYWDVVWAENYPNINMNPTKVTLTIDGTEVATNDQRWNAPDNLNTIVALAEKNGKFLGAYTNLTEAMGKFNGRTVRVLRNVTESFEGFYGVTLEGEDITITNTYTGWTDFDDVVLSSGVTVVSPLIYSGDSENTIYGTLIVGSGESGTYYHAYDAKTTICEGGKVVVNGSTILRYNKEADAGIYVYGDGDESTIEFDCAYYVGAYSGTFYAKDATVEVGYFLLKNSNDNDTYANIALSLDNSTITVVSTTDTQDSFIIDDKASITMTNCSAIKDVRDFNILAGTKLTLNVDATSYFNATYVNVASDVPYTFVKDDNGNVTFTAKAE